MLIPLDRSAADQGAEVGVFGGSGFYDLLDDAVDVEPHTPYGPPASPIRVGMLGGRRVAFLARHGLHHQFAPHRVPFQANVWAMAAMGVRSIVAPCSVGSLRADMHPGELVIVDQLVDRTKARPDTFHDVGADDATPGSEGVVHHQGFAEPYDPDIRAALISAGETLPNTRVHPRGTMVVIEGPRFSTRAESMWFREMGWHVINMTGYPEAVLAAEANVRYASVALITDYDAGVDGHDPVTMEEVLATMRDNIDHVRALIEAALPDLP